MADAGRRRPPVWEWEEIVLACDLLIQNDRLPLDHEDRRVVEVSELLQQMTLHPLKVRPPEFRNANGVAQKIRNIVQHLPGYVGAGSHGNHLDGEVLHDFLDKPDVMHAYAESLRKSIANGEPPDFPREVGYENESQMEGRYLLRLHAYRERSPKLRKQKIDRILAETGKLSCQVCEFDFAKTYGDRGKGYIEAHHVESLSAGGEKPRSIEDLALLCSNCHRMIHTKPPWPTPAQLRELIDRQARP
jgi:5-methylcytosine-specific restriction protein A